MQQSATDDFMPGGYYDRFGVWIPPGTFFTTKTCPTVEWVNLATPRAKELAIRHKYGVLTKFEQSEWDDIEKRLVAPIRGQIQKDKWTWKRGEFDFQERFIQVLDEVMLKHREFERETAAQCIEELKTRGQ